MNTRTMIGFVRLLSAAVFSIAALHAKSTCLEDGGHDLCQAATYLDSPTVSLCDNVAPTVFRQHAWCDVLGGTWDGAHGVCTGILATVPSGGGTYPSAFESEIHGPSCGAAPSPPGPCTTNDFCGCTNQTSMNLLTYHFDTLPFEGNTTNADGSCGGPWAENVIVGYHQPVGCPPGWLSGSGDSDRPCMKPQDALICPGHGDCVGNPVNLGSGAKIQKEVDYVAAGPGGLRFERIYNSAGFFERTARQNVNADYWRTNYSSRVIDYSGNAYLMAVVQQADGTLVPFNTSGAESQNNDGASRTLAKHVDGGGAITGWTMTTPASDVEEYDSTGKLTSITTRSGFVTTLSYDGSGLLQTITDTFGRAITLTYDANGWLLTMTDPHSRVYTYGYDGKGRLITATYPDSTVRSYLYENATYIYALTGITDERGVRVSTYGYDGNGRANLTQHTGPDDKWTVSVNDSPTGVTTTATDGYGTSHTFAFTKVNGAVRRTSDQDFYLGTQTWSNFDANGNAQSFTDRNSNVTHYTYDLTRNLETSRTEAYGTSIARTITTTWNSTYRLPATITEPSGTSGVNQVTTFTYDTSGNLTKKNITAGTKVREWNYTVNSRGQVLTIDGPRTDVTDVTTITYYGDTDTCVGCRGQVHTVTNALSQVTSFDSYDADGRPTQITDANGVATTLTYKKRGWLASRSTAGEITTYDYDQAGNLTLVTMPDSSWISYEYDAANAVVGVGNSLGDSIDYELDVMGNRVGESVYDPAGNLRKMLQREWDGANRLAYEMGASSQTTSYTYDGDKNLKTVTDPMGRVTTNTYDALNRLTQVNDAAGGNTNFTYDAKGRLASVQDPKLSSSFKTTYTYDPIGNLTTQVSPDTGTTTFTYDDAGNVATQTDARSTTTTYTYDALNRVTAATVTDGTVTYEYDNNTTGGSYAKGHLTKITDPSGNTAYAYDSLGRITSKTQTVTASPSNKSFTVGYSYSSGRQTGITYPSGRAITYTFDAKGSVASIAVDGTTTILSGATYFPFGPPSGWTWGNGEPMQRVYDLDGRVSALTLGPAAATYASLAQTYGYDSLNRLTSADLGGGSTQSYTYDANSNRTNLTVNGSSSTNYTYPSSSHRLSSLSGATSKSFTYDNAGNTTASGSLALVYDGRGRMKQAGTTTYLVNGLGQRVRKNTGSDTYFAYDEAGHVIGEYDSSGNPIEETVWLQDLPVAIIKPNGGSFSLFYVWTDNLGSPRQVSDTSNVVRWIWDNNDPFGKNASNENPAGVGAFNYNLRFSGQYADSESGLNYNYFRDYDPTLGRYAESDPIGISGGPNTYVYTMDKPLKARDPYGLQFGGSIALPPISRPVPLPIPRPSFPIPMPLEPGDNGGNSDDDYERWERCMENCASMRNTGLLLCRIMHGWPGEENHERWEKCVSAVTLQYNMCTAKCFSC